MSAPDCTYELATASSTAAPTDSGVGNREIGRAVGGDLVIALDLASGKKIGRLGARLNEPQVKKLIVAICGERLEDLGEVEGLGGHRPSRPPLPRAPRKSGPRRRPCACRRT